VACCSHFADSFRWYHDHAIDHTAENAYFGLAGFYIMHDDDELAVPGLPQGDYDIPLGLASKRYNADGTLWSPEANGETTSVYGDVIQVNGQPWPYLSVEPRKYRFRFLNSAVSRSFQLYLVDDAANTTRLPFTVVGSDAGLTEKPVSTTQLDISMAERWEVVVDFSSYAGKNLTYRNNRNVGADKDYPETDKVMRKSTPPCLCLAAADKSPGFVVGSSKTAPDQPWDSQSLPATLRTVPYPPPAKAGQLDHLFEFQSKNGGWRVNGVGWADGPEARVLAKPSRGAVEVWDLKNPAGGWTHPIHIHLVSTRLVQGWLCVLMQGTG
jgi:bilirubin oxidase